ncbi:MAG TPA: tyrosine-type recombinase/integrase [Alphaproteobacteria bacterium]|nr:tyrosine-type recombinase/integrase [Alphaproteobacteria bacterium]
MPDTLARTDSAAILLPETADKDTHSRLARFVKFLDHNDTAWYLPDLMAYRDELLTTLSPASVAAHLSTIRARYRTLMASNAIRDLFFALASRQTADPLIRKALVDEMMTRLSNAVNPVHSGVTVETQQDRVAADELRLTVAQATALLRKPGVDTLRGLRDTALIALSLATGLREAELAALEVSDLRQQGSDGQTLGIYVREGKGAKSRFVPYGDNEQVLAIIDKWLHAADISEGRVFRGFRHHSQTPTASLTPRAIQAIFAAHPIMVRNVN